MASRPGVQSAKDALDMWLSGGAVVRFWKVAPDGYGAGGTESVPAGGAPTASFQPAVEGTGGQVAKATSTGAVTFPGMPDPSSAITAISFHDPSDDHLIVVDDSWTAPGAGWSAGDSPQLAYVSVPFVPVA